MTAVDFNTILPEFLLAAFALGALMFGAYGGKDKTAATLVWATSGLFIALALFIGFGTTGERMAFGGLFTDDPFARFAKVIILVSAACVMLMSQDYMLRRDLLRFEFPILVTLAVIGMMVMVSAGDLMTLYMGLELQSLSLYVVAAMRRDSTKSSEAGLKYFVLGALSSGLFLYGASLAYGFAGTTQFAGILSTLGGDTPAGLTIGLVFMLAALAFKVSAAPFHMWTPDVYEGSPTPITAFFATAPKVAAMALIARLVHDAFGAIPGEWTQVLAALAVVSMFLGGIAAIGQRDIKRLMAYSSIGHMGFALVGLAAGTPEGAQGVLVYIAIYLAMTLASFSVILAMKRQGQAVEKISDFAGLARTNPLLAFFFAMLLFSLAGIPPLAGFFAKFYVFLAAIKAGLFVLAVLGVLSSVVGAFYYLTIIKTMYFDEPIGAVDPVRVELRAVLAIAGTFTILFFVYPAPLVNAAAAAAKSLF